MTSKVPPIWFTSSRKAFGTLQPLGPLGKNRTITWCTKVENVIFIVQTLTWKVIGLCDAKKVNRKIFSQTSADLAHLCQKFLFGVFFFKAVTTLLPSSILFEFHKSRRISLLTGGAHSVLRKWPAKEKSGWVNFVLATWHPT